MIACLTRLFNSPPRSGVPRFLTNWPPKTSCGVLHARIRPVQPNVLCRTNSSGPRKTGTKERHGVPYRKRKVKVEEDQERYDLSKSIRDSRWLTTYLEMRENKKVKALERRVKGLERRRSKLRDNEVICIRIGVTSSCNITLDDRTETSDEPLKVEDGFRLCQLGWFDMKGYLKKIILAKSQWYDIRGEGCIRIRVAKRGGITISTRKETPEEQLR